MSTPTGPVLRVPLGVLSVPCPVLTPGSDSGGTLTRSPGATVRLESAPEADLVVRGSPTDRGHTVGTPGSGQGEYGSRGIPGKLILRRKGRGGFVTHQVPVSTRTRSPGAPHPTTVVTTAGCPTLSCRRVVGNYVRPTSDGLVKGPCGTSWDTTVDP